MAKQVQRVRRPFRKFVLAFVFILVAAVGSAGAVLYREFAVSLPPVERLLDYRPPVASRVLADDGSVIGELYFEKRYLTPIYKVPKTVQLAFIAAEDAHFYEHTGVDLASILRAAINNYKAGSTRQGGSTITQQVVKSLLLTPERSYERKLKELVLAIRLERELTKDEILYLYLNQIYLGNGAYGVQAAAEEYFGKDISDVSLAEAAMLAGLPQAPSRYSPVHHFRNAKARQEYVLERMADEGFINVDQAAAAAKEPIVLVRHKPAVGGPAPYFVEYVRRLLESRYGASAPYQLGLNIHTTVNLALQRAADQALRAGVNELDDRQGFRGPLRKLSSRELRALSSAPAAEAPLPDAGTLLEVAVMPVAGGGATRRDGGVNVRWAGGAGVIPAAGLTWATRSGYGPAPGDVFEARVTADHPGAPPGHRTLELTHNNGTQGAFIATIPQTGDVKAMTGGLDFAASQFNRVTQAYRQPGSSFKPLVYAAAMDRGFTPATIINDAPVSFTLADHQVWSPHNFEEKYFGPTSLRDALTFSRNVVTVKLVEAMGLRYLLSYLPRFGFSRPFPKNLSIALGSSEVTLIEMARAFAVFPNLGTRVEPRFISRITDLAGETLEEFPVKSTPALSPDTAFIMINMMRSVIERGTGRRAAALGRPCAGKTGTTNDLRDAWFIGYTPDLLAGIWVGYDHDKTLGDKETGGRVAAPIWLKFMQQALDGKPVTDFSVPDGVMLVNIDPRSGLRAGPGIAHPVLEAFKKGHEPTAFAGMPEKDQSTGEDEGDLGVRSVSAAVDHNASDRPMPGSKTDAARDDDVGGGF